MTQWSREYLYTGTEKRKEAKAETCRECRHSKPIGKRESMHLCGLAHCTLRGKVIAHEHWCKHYKK